MFSPFRALALLQHAARDTPARPRATAPSRTGYMTCMGSDRHGTPRYPTSICYPYRVSIVSM
eukprot:1428953-Pleurochrysis_carterae.AAC.1